MLYVVIAFFLTIPVFSQLKNEAELKKQAEKYFDEEDYNGAYKLFSQLVSLYPKDPDYNYKLGVCMLYTEPDKKKPYSYLLIATQNPAEAPKDAKFYLAKTYHINYKFDEAIKLYTEYKKIGSASSVKKLQVDREIQACKNGKRLLSNLSDLVVVNKKEMNEADYFRSYDVKDIGGKLLVKPDEFKSSYDKKKKDKSVIYLPRNGERLYFSSYGENGARGRDLYFVNKLPDGSWSKPQILPVSINTEFDEDYPFLHPNGKTLYFSSKGHNSMGGYDVFKTTFNEETQTWSNPVNLEFPINSPDDDILFVTDSLEKTAFFSTGRYSPYGKIDVLRINTERRPMNFALLKGTVVKEEAGQSLKSKITVKNMANGETVGTYQAQDNGDYYMELPNGGKFIFTVETPNIETQSQSVQVPVAYSLKPYRQVVSYDKKILKIINYFDGDVSDENYAMMLDLIEKKARLEVNENDVNTTIKDPGNTPKTGEDPGLNSVSTTNPTVQGNNSTTKTNTNKNVTNEQLLSMAKMDAQEASTEAKKLKQEAQDAFGLATQKTAEAADLQKKADDATTNANALTDITKKNEDLAAANELKTEADMATSVANTATNLAKKLEVDAQSKQKEADLTNQYIQQLEAITKNKNNKEALTKLEQIQKELDNISTQKNQSDELFASIKAESELKQEELKKSEKKNEDIINETAAIKAEATTLETDLANENDKAIKENISAQIRELNNDIETKNTELATNTKKIETLKNQVEGLNKELDIASKILNEDASSIASSKPDAKQNESKSTDSNSSVNQEKTAISNSESTALSYQGITAMYKEKMSSAAIDPNNKQDLAKQNDILKNYNKDLTDLISIDKNEVTKTKSATEKKTLNDEIKNLEKLKSDNNKAIANNSSKIKQLDSNALAGNSTNPANKSSVTGNEGNRSDPINTNTASTTISSNNESPTNATAISGNGIANSSNEPLVGTTAAATEAAKSIRVDANDPAVYTNELETLKKDLDANSKASTEIFEQATYTEPGAQALKLAATQQLDNARKKEVELKNLISNTETTLNTFPGTSADELINEADALNDQAFSQRKESATKTGPEKEALVNQAVDKEKTAIQKRLEAAELFKKQNKDRFDVNSGNLSELKTVTGTKTSDGIVQANLLIEEASFNYKQGAKLREEASTYPDGSAKLGGLSNAEEKENEALTKQQKALDLLLKENPSYTLKTPGTSVNAKDAITNVNSNLESLSQAQLEAYLALSKANQNELTSRSEKLINNNAYKDPANQNSRDLKEESDRINKESSELVSKSLVAGTSSEKANLLLKANEKELAAIKKLGEAEASLSQGVASKNAGVTNPDKTNDNGIPPATVGTNTQVTEPVSTNTVAVKEPELNLEGKDSFTNNPETNSTNSNSSVASNPTTTVNAISNATLEANQTALNNDSNSSTNPAAARTGSVEANDAAVSNTIAPEDPLNTSNTAIINSTDPSSGTGVGKEAEQLKAGLNNSAEAGLTDFSTYSNKESVAVRNQALEKMNTALNEDKQISAQLDQITELAIKDSSSNNVTVTPASINSLLTDADNLNDKAFGLRKSAADKPAEEKEKDLADAKALEIQAMNKKIEASLKQQQFNNALYEANAQSLKELEVMAQGKNINELSNASAMVNESDAAFKEAKKLREETENYSDNSAKLGGYNNAEEKEALAIAKQETLLTTYKKYFSNYVPKTATASSGGSDARAKLNETKASLKSNNQKHIDGLLLLSQANQKEYQNRFVSLKAPLNPEQSALKTRAQTAYKKQQSLVTQASQMTDLLKKKNALVEANASGQESITLLNQINSKASLVSKTTSPKPNVTDGNTTNLPANAVNTATTVSVKTRTVSAIRPVETENAVAATSEPSGNKVTTPKPPVASKTNTSTTSAKLKVEGLEIKKTNAYSDSKPIPLDEKMPDGLVFKVQVGAFKTALPNDQFKGLSPVIAQTAPSGFIRYMAGDFQKYESANAVKNDLKNLGYNDAFVVAYYNGKRINLNEATDRAKVEGQVVDVTSTASAGITENSNVPRSSFPVNPANAVTTIDTQPVEITKELEQTNGLLYTVQIGVFSQKITRTQLNNLKPIYTEKLPNGLYRYTAGIYNQPLKLLEDKGKVVDLGVKDAFVSAYYNAKRISFGEGKKIQAEDVSLKMEKENPIIFPDANTVNITQAPIPTTTVQTAVNPANAFSNGVTTGPAPTPDNGVKTDEAGITFKVQIGAYKNQVPNDVASKFMTIKTWPVSYVVINGLFIYTIGNFSGNSYAKKLRDEAILLGLTDAYITVYKDGNKLYGAEAERYINQ